MGRDLASRRGRERFPGHGDGAGLELGELSTAEERTIVRRLTNGSFDAWASAAARVGYCTNPIRVRGSSTSFDRDTGQPLQTFNTLDEAFGVLHLRCGNRRADVCPSCSRVYAADTFHLIRCGLTGGKGVPDTVADNLLVFATLTAPSFGSVHGVRDGSRRCHPRSGPKSRCPHGRSMSCMLRHGPTDPGLGQPLCWECYDYASHVVWQWWAPELWRRFTITLRRLIAKTLGVKPRDLNEHATLQYAKVAEFQLRGIVHFHALVRLDGPKSDAGFAPSPPSIDPALLALLVEEASRAVSFTAPSALDDNLERGLRFGSQVDARGVRTSRRTDDPERPLQPEQVAGYLAKYATKSATESADGGSNPHLQRIQAVAAAIADCAQSTANLSDPDEHDIAYERMANWVHMLGFRGHFATKSHRYSITLGALRRARRRAQTLIALARREGRRIDLAGLEAELMADDEDETTLVIGDWRFAGAGWETAGDAALAKAAAARAREYAQWKSQQRRRTRPRRSNVHAT